MKTVEWRGARGRLIKILEEKSLDPRGVVRKAVTNCCTDGSRPGEEIEEKVPCVQMWDGETKLLGSRFEKRQDHVVCRARLRDGVKLTVPRSLSAVGEEALMDSRGCDSWKC